MTGIGLFLIYLGYAVIYWSLRAIQGESQDSFITYLYPSANKSGGGSQNASPPTPAGSPANTKAAANASPTGRTASNVAAKVKGQGL